MVDTQDLKSCLQQCKCGSDSRLGHKQNSNLRVAFFMQYFVYILYSKKLDRYYTGTTDDVEKRLLQHNTNYYPGTFTVKGIPWEIYLSIPCLSSEAAFKLEAFIKRMKSKAFIHKLKEHPEIIQDIVLKF